MSDGCKFTSGEVVSATSDPRFLDGSSDCVFEVGATILLMGEKVTSTQRQTQSSGAVKKEVKKMPAPTSEITSSPQASSEQQVATEAASPVDDTTEAASVQSGDEHLHRLRCRPVPAQMRLQKQHLWQEIIQLSLSALRCL
jgi:hypothetical protein